MELDLAATCRREWPACSRLAALLEASAGYEEWRDVVASASSRRILDRLQTPQQTVADAVEQGVAVQ